EKRRERDEQIRLLYVAFTRAKERLILLGSDTVESTSLAGALEAAELWPRLGPGTSHLDIPLGRALDGATGVSLKRVPKLPVEPEKAAQAWKRRVEERDELQEQPRFVTASSSVAPAQAGAQTAKGRLGSGFRRSDEESRRDDEVYCVRGDLVGRLCHKALE